MAAPNAPMPLFNQIKAGTNIVVTVVLRSIGPAPGFVDGAAGFNNGDPTATFTIPLATMGNVPGAGAIEMWPGEITEIVHNLEDLWQSGQATVT